MQNENIFIIAAISIFFILLSIIYSIGFYELTIDWEMVSSIIVGIYLYFAYLILSIFLGKPKNQIRHSQTKMPQLGKSQKTYSNSVYEY
ncbi:MAG: hypothetical protein H0X02_06870 [Nitrosomonas sp.]|nr:hypothetical protein [Nitrosomonas sp.]